MEFALEAVTVGQKEILRNLLEKYNYEFSQYDGTDINDLGLYGYSYLDNYWTEKGRWAFFLKADGRLAGFAMVNDYPEAGEPIDYCMSEFFVMYKYHRCGLGTWAVYQLFDRFQGLWQLKRTPRNEGSVYFWDKMVDGYTGGHFKLESRADIAYDDGTPADLFTFRTDQKGQK